MTIITTMITTTMTAVRGAVARTTDVVGPFGGL